MADVLNIGKAQFTAHPVSAATAEAVLSDPIPKSAVWRDVWRWDGTTGKVLVAATEKAAVPLPNALVFRRARADDAGVVATDPEASKKMAQRFLETVGAPDLKTVMQALAKVMTIPHKALPLDRFERLKPVVGFTLKQHTDFVVLELRGPDGISAFLCLPNRVSYHHEIAQVLDEIGFEDLMAEAPELREVQPSFVVPAKSVANAKLRRMALAKRADEMAAAKARLPAGAGGEVARQNMEARTLRLAEEQRALTPAKAKGGS
ncbi:hypothetical protein [Histidinibacterium aquaticum]|uniref:Uncharacterized protein n=1 Tax=Histidinibacterium aquaticum TaxID=2613962 RepID=A0A5J5GD44_9RHOB|nr:hypothetical protein [Histidinibacterium aquaticum]KAA9006119.1 hypothetical protein F3S47_16360 [Histidinibacterium aquaticum]